jgi:hypothetical protein
MRIVHIQTTIQAVFGVLDDDGNAIPQQPVTVQVTRFSPEAFGEAYGTIAAQRDKAAATDGPGSG